jgi:hypothetical protein
MNTRDSSRFVIIAGLMVLAYGCVTPPKWEDSTGNEYADAEGGYAVTLPSGWSWIKYNEKSPLLSTRDGPDLQAIRVFFRKHEKAFPAIDQDSSADMTPRELAELFVADLRKERGVGTIDIVDNIPADLGGSPGFRVELAWRSESGLRYRAVAYGCATARGLYVITYNAPVLHYYEKSIGPFETSVQTFRFLV